MVEFSPATWEVWVEVAYSAQAAGVKYIGMRNEQAVSICDTNIIILFNIHRQVMLLLL